MANAKSAIARKGRSVPREKLASAIARAEPSSCELSLRAFVRLRSSFKRSERVEPTWKRGNRVEKREASSANRYIETVIGTASRPASLASFALAVLVSGCVSTFEGSRGKDPLVHLRVVDEATGIPQPGAEIYYLDLSKYDVREWQELGMMRWSVDEVRQRYCTSVVADFRGEAHVPRSADIHGVEALLEDRWG